MSTRQSGEWVQNLQSQRYRHVEKITAEGVFKGQQSARTVFLFLVMNEAANDNLRRGFQRGFVMPGAGVPKIIAKKTGLGTSTVYRAMDWLHEQGFIEVKEAAGDCYRFIQSVEILSRDEATEAARRASDGKNQRPEVRTRKPREPKPATAGFSHGGQSFSHGDERFSHGDEYNNRDTNNVDNTTAEPDADVVGDLSGEDLPGPDSTPSDQEPASPGPAAEQPSPGAGRSSSPGRRAKRGKQASPGNRAESDSWAEKIIRELNKRIKDDVASISTTAKLKTMMEAMAKEYTPDLVEMAMIWAVEGFSPMKMGNPGGFLTSQLPDVIHEYIRARNKEASRQGLDPETFNLMTWCLDQQKLEETAAGAMEKIGKLLSKAISTDSDPEAMSLFTKSCEIYHNNRHVSFEQSQAFEPHIAQVLEKALKHKREDVFLKVREHCQSEKIAQAS
jgi:hypothetical protein